MMVMIIIIWTLMLQTEKSNAIHLNFVSRVDASPENHLHL